MFNLVEAITTQRTTIKGVETTTVKKIKETSTAMERTTFSNYSTTFNYKLNFTSTENSTYGSTSVNFTDFNTTIVMTTPFRTTIETVKKKK